MIYDLLIGPIETIVEWTFLFITDKISFIGIIGAIIGVSIVINFLALPLYNIADKIKEKESLIQLKLQPQADRIKKAFKGDERFMMMQTMYRQNNYHPFYSLRSSLAILIEIPFFIAAYHYLSHNELLQNAFLNIGLINLNLGQPDHLFKIGKLYINLLPILMTLINIISSMIYSKGSSRKELIQLYGLSLIFLILLYESPSGLVIYWICNNIFSLLKNILQKSKYGKKFVYTFFVLMLFFTCIAMSKQHNISKSNLMIVWIFFICFITIPLFMFKVFKKQTNVIIKKIDEKAEVSFFIIFIISSCGLALLLGFLLPSSVIATSPIEFSCLGKTNSPYSYVLSSLYFFTGLCVIWPLVIYKMFSKRTKYFISLIFFTLFICSLTNVYIFNYDYGNISQTFAFESAAVFEHKSKIYVFLPLLVFALSIVLFLCLKNRKIKSTVLSILCSICIAELSLGVYKSYFIIKKYNANKENLLAAKRSGEANKITPVFNLAKEETGKKNVIVIFLDRGINSYIPKFLEHFPQLQKSFDGFTWYKNALSFGNFTTVGVPAMIGGYEYTPEKINERNEELLRDKHNEACLVMPKLFLDSGWNVTITDPPLPNYSEKTDLIAFKQFPQMKVQELAGKYDSNYLEALNTKGREVDKICKKQSRNFCIIQALYPKARLYFYNVVKDSINETSFEHYYSSLYFFNQLTEFNSQNNNFFFIENDATHPDSDTPDWGTDNKLLIAEDEIAKYYDYKDSTDLVHYRVNALCINEVGKWLDYLKENNAYNNSRIIIVSDHGRGIHLEEFNTFKDYTAPAYFAALFMYKDFGSTGPVLTDETFMMNADTLFLAKENLGLSDINPFTGKKLIQEKDGEMHIYYAATRSTTKIYDNKEFDLKKLGGWAVKENIFDEANWRRLE